MSSSNSSGQESQPPRGHGQGTDDPELQDLLEELTDRFVNSSPEDIEQWIADDRHWGICKLAFAFQLEPMAT